MARRKRRVFELRWSRALKRWVIVERGVRDSLRAMGSHGDRALQYARQECRRRHDRGELVQLVVRACDGHIRFEHTYGDDPRSRKG